MFSRASPTKKKKKRPPYPKYPTLGACRATKPHKRGHVHSPPTPWVLGVAWPCAWALCGHSEQVSTVFLAPHMSIHRHMDRFSQKSGYFWSNFEKIISKSASKWDSTPLKTSILGGLRLNGQSPISRSAKHGDPRKQKKIQLKSHYIRPLSSLRVL